MNLKARLTGLIPFTAAPVPMAATWRYALLAVLVVYAVMAAIQSVMVPVFEGPDEQRHYAYARHLVNYRSLPPLYKEPDDISYTYKVGQEAGQPPLYYGLVALVTAPLPHADDIAPLVQPNPFMTAYDAVGIGNDNHNRYLHGPERNEPLHGASLAVHVGRLVSVVLGLISLLGVYGAAREVSPSQPLVALLAAALLACLPVFLFLNSAITNDAAVICFATLSTWVAMRMARRGVTLRLAALGGLFAGLTALSKFNGIWIIAVVGLATLGAQLVHRSKGERFNLLPLLVAVVMWLLTVGWWFTRNYLAAGDPFGITIHAIGDQSPLRLGKSALENFGTRLADLEASVWYASGWAALIPAPGWLYTLYRALFGFGILGAAVAAVEAWLVRGSWRRLDTVAVLQGCCLMLCILLALLGGIYWILVYMWSIGRLMFAAIASLAVLAGVGWTWWFGKLALASPPAVSRLLPGVFAIALLYGSIGGIVTAVVALGPNPEISSMTDKMSTTQLTFLDPAGQGVPIASVVGYELVPQDVRAGGFLYAKICWKSHGFTTRSYPYSVQLVGEGDVRPATRNSYHGLGSYPMALWKPGETFCDPISLRPSGDIYRPRAYKLLVSMFDITTEKGGHPLPVIDGNGRPAYPVIANVRVAPNHQQDAAQRGGLPKAFVGDFAALLDARVQVSAQPTSGVVLSVTLRWVARNPTPVDAKVFMHVLDKTGNAIAQSDHEPDGGWFPTNDWQRGDIIEDHFQVDLPRGVRVDDVRVALGMYDAETVQRLPAVDAARGERLPNDMVFVQLNQ
jgi:4-amino-4-deoxy-L-arabinose transferase-like glycosyltransferase